MNRQEKIVYKVLEKVQKNGWYSDTVFKVINWDGSIGTSMFLHGTYTEDGRIETWQRDLETLFFQPYFAKAFWGEVEVCNYCGLEIEECEHEEEACCCFKFYKNWQYHLQQLAIAEDRLSYLETFLEKE